LVEVVITLVVAGPALGFLSPYAGPQYVVGFGLDLNAINPQLQQIFSGSNFEGGHQITVPVHNEWFFPASASLSLELIAGGQVVYQTSTSTVNLAPFQSGSLVLSMQISPAVASELAGKDITVGGTLGFGAPSYLWSFNVTFPGS
jgi:hypothetical protein